LPVDKCGPRAGPPACGQECNHQWLLEIAPSVFYQRHEYASYFPLIIFFLPKWYNILLFFKGLSHNLTLSKIVAEGEPLERKSFKKAHEKRRVIRWELTKKYLTVSLGN